MQKALELLQGQGKVASMQNLEAKAKAQMIDKEYQEFKELYDKLKEMDHDLWVAFMVDIGYTSGELFFLTSFKVLR